jgi:hypothetical protein
MPERAGAGALHRGHPRGAHGPKPHGQSLHSAQHDRVLPFECIGCELQVLKPREDARERDLRLDPRERGAQAKVGAVAEGEVAVVGALDVEPVGVGKAPRVAVGGVHPGINAFARLELPPARLVRDCDHARERAARPVVTQAFLDRIRGKFRPRPQLRKLRGVAQEREYPVADQVRGGLVPGEQQQAGGCLRFCAGVLIVPSSIRTRVTSRPTSTSAPETKKRKSGFMISASPRMPDTQRTRSVI